MTTNSWLVIACLLAAVSFACQSATATILEKKAASWKLLVLVLGGFCQFFSLFFLWYSQQAFTYQWNSKIVLEVTLDKEKSFEVFNAGLVDLENITISLTEYDLDLEQREGGHLYVRGVKSYSKWSGPFKTRALLRSGDRMHFSLLDPEWKNALRFYDVADIAHLNELMGKVYCFRVAFRNAITKEKRVHYFLASSSRSFPSTLDPVQGVGAGGPVLADHPYDPMVKIRNIIRTHQQGLFDDSIDDLYRK